MLPFFLVARVASAEPPAARPNPLLAQLLEAVGSPINVELKSGELATRVILVRVRYDRKKQVIHSLQIQEAAGAKPRTVSFVSIRALRLDRETIYEALPDEARTPAEKRAQELARQTEEEREQWVERARRNRVKPWPELSKEDHDAAIQQQKEMCQQIARAIPGMELAETQEFLFFTNIPPVQIAPYLKALDGMHDTMCELYGIRRGEPVWLGKCLVVALLTQGQYASVEETFFDHHRYGDSQGWCHRMPDGRVVICCYRGDWPDDFAHIMVHETSHGFNYRYRTWQLLPPWVDEGMAECIGRLLVPACPAVLRREKLALQAIREQRTLGGILTRETKFNTIGYGTASHLNAFLMRSDKIAYRSLIQGVKEGSSWRESLQASFKCTPEEMVSAYGKAIGVPDLRP